MRITKLLAVLLVGLVAFPLAADARPSKELTAELQGYVDATRAEDNARATMYALMTDGVINGKKGAKALEEQAKSSDPMVRLGAAMGLVLAGAPKAKEALAAELKADPQLYIKLSQVVRLLPDSDEKVVLKALVKAAKTPQQRDVFRYLAGQYGALYESLGDYLMDADASVRGAALEATLFTTRDGAAAFAEKMIKSKDEAVRADGLKLAMGLAESQGGSAPAVQVLEGALQSKSPTIATQAARHLVKLGKPTGSEFLGASLSKITEDDQKLEVATYLLEHSARISAAAAADLMKAENEKLQAAGWQLAAATGDAEVLQKLLEMFGSTHFDERIIAVNALGKTHAKQAVAPLSAALFEGNRDIRLGAARALGQLGDAGALDALQKAIGGERDVDVKIAAVNAIASIDNPKSLQLLRFQTTARDPQVKLAVVQGIRKLGNKEGVQALSVVRNDRDLKVQWEAFLTTLELSPKEGLTEMPRALRNPPAGFIGDILQLKEPTRTQVLTYLLRSGKDAARAQALTAALRNSESLLGLFRELVVDEKVDEDTRLALLQVLSAKRAAADKALFEKLARSAAPIALKHAAVATLIEYGGEDLSASFRGLLGNKDSIIKAQAALGLAVAHQ